jgi:hypothetical protein
MWGSIVLTLELMRSSFMICKCLRIVILLSLAFPSLLISGDVLQHHLNGTRNGFYIDPLITRKSAAATHRDRNFNASLPGPVYAQPLYVEKGPGGKRTLFVVTEQNAVLALDAASGAQIWAKRLGNPVPLSQLPCGNIDPVGITGTPVIDATTRTIYIAAMVTPDGGRTKQHLIFALSLDDGTTRTGWPINLYGMKYNKLSFNAAAQNQRGALALSSGTLYVPYGGHYGDCDDYHGWVIAVPVSDPKSATAWATQARAGGIWAPGGIATDDSSMFVATGNTFGAKTWAGGEAIIRLSRGAQFNSDSKDYFTPSNWRKLDDGDTDVGGSGPVLVDVPGATPSELVVAFGKNGVAYLLDKNNLGGIGRGDGFTGEGVQSKRVSNGQIINAAAAYTTASGTYVVTVAQGNGIGCPGRPGNLIALRIGASAPPSINVAWCANNMGGGSPIVTSTDGKSEPIVWTVGANSSNRLHAFDGETGELLFAGGGPEEQISAVQNFQTLIVANGRIYVAASYRIYEFVSQ